jgi:hypothetical protein
MKSDDDVPVLICLTHADNLYLECVAKEKEYKIEAIEDKRKAIQRELQVCQYGFAVNNFECICCDFD